METPILPQEWLNLKLEFTEEYLLKRERIKLMQEFKNREIQNYINDGSILKRPGLIKPISIINNKNEKITDYDKTVKSYDTSCLEKKKCIIM